MKTVFVSVLLTHCNSARLLTKKYIHFEYENCEINLFTLFQTNKNKVMKVTDYVLE